MKRTLTVLGWTFTVAGFLVLDLGAGVGFWLGLPIIICLFMGGVILGYAEHAE